MASYLLHPSTIFTKIYPKKLHFQPSNTQIPKINPTHFISRPYFPNKPSKILNFPQNPCSTTTKSSQSPSPTSGFLDNLEKDESFSSSSSIQDSPVKFLFWVCLWASVSVALFAFSPDDAKAQQAESAVKSIKASGFGLKVAGFLRGSGWPDPVVVFALATLPVIELRGAIPVGYWLQLNPVVLTALSVLGNMVPVPLIVLYLKPLATFLAGTNKTAARLLNLLFENAKQKAGPIEEFRWLGLMLFVAVPFPGTGAWTGAIIASILDLPFWSAVSANFFGVVLAGLLVNMLVNIGLKYAVVACIVMFIASGFMWSLLRILKQRLSSSS
ncbi:putative small multi-drug export [Helianthus annuus]|nr:putative small multi-drug export [Helianthus annuus]